MKITLIVLFVTVIPYSLSASAEVLNDPTSANIANLNYYPHKGILTVEPSYDSNVNTLSNGSRISRNDFVLFGEYGLPWVDGLRIGIHESDSINAEAIGQSTFSHSGLGDPTFSVHYRIFDDTPGGFSLDAGISTTPPLASSDISYANLPGGNGGGRYILGLFAAGFWRVGPNEAALGGEVKRYFSGTDTDPLNLGNTISIGAKWVASTGIRDRIHLLPALFLQGEANLEFGNSQNSTHANGQSTGASVPFNVSPTVGLGFLAKRDVLLSLYFEYQGYDIQHANTSTSSSYVSTSFGFHAMIEL